MHKTKRSLSFLLAVLMIVSMFAAVPFTASAEDKVIGEGVIFKQGDTIVLPGSGDYYVKAGRYGGASPVSGNGTITRFEAENEYSYMLEIDRWYINADFVTFDYWDEMEQGLSVLGITFTGSGTESDPYLAKLAFGVVESTWAGEGEGTEASPWLIKDLNDLRTLSANVASDMKYTGKYFKLTADIDCGSDNWEPIGGDKSFAGTFDGDGKTITYSIICSENDASKGLFAEIGSAGTVKNLNVAGSIVNTAEYAGPAGGIAAYNRGLIENCYSAVDITKGCDRGTGGIAAWNDEGATIRYCAASGTLTWTGASDFYAYIGGITGENYNYNDDESEIKIKYVTNCAMLGDVLAQNATDQYNYAGRLIGRQYDDTTSDDCYYLDTMTVTGMVYSDSVTAKTAEELKAIGQAAIDAGYTVYGLALGGSLSNPEGTPLTDQLPSTQGTYYLTQDITISSTWLAPSGATTIDLNGYGIRMTGTGTVIDVCRDASCVLTLNDSRPTYSGGENRPSGILGGYITGGTGSKTHPGTSNASYIVGGGIYVNNAVLNINGGTIYGNSAAWGGGIYINNDCTVNMTGGAITGNSCARGGYGGGVFLSATSTFNVSHTPSITGNYYSYNGKQYPRNVHMQVVYSGGKPLYAVITIVSPGLTAGAQIGIYEYQTNAYPVTSGYSTYHSGVDPGTYFSCDNAGWAYKVNSEGELLSVPAFTITWLNEDGTLIDTTTVAGGTVPTHADATKDATAQYTYTFAGWTPAVAEATRDATYTATFTQTDREYTITWKNDDGSVIDTTTVAYGTVPTHADATKDADAQYTYTFAGWDTAPVAVTGDATYTATFTTSPSPAALVIEKINAIGTVEYTDASKEKIDDARAAYDALTDTQKELVTNYTTLTDAETSYANLKAAAELAQAKTDAKAELANYKDPADYRPAQQTELTNAINAGNDAIDAAADIAGVNTALANAKTAIDAIKTDAELTAEEAAAALAQAKADAKAELANYKDPADYRPAQQTELTNAINAGNDAIDAAADIAGVNTALANAKTAIDAIKTDAELTAEEAAAALAQAKTDAKAELANYKDPADYRPAQQTELTNAINAGNDTIDGAEDIAGVNTALANAKTAIDAIKTDAELTAEEAAAALAQAKTDAKAELANYKEPADYRPAQQTELTNAINAGNDAIDAAADIAGVNTELANAKAAVDAIKTDAQLTAEELAAAKRTAKSALLSYKDTHDYRAEQKAELSNAIDDGIAAINAATNTDEVAAALEAAKAVMDAIKTDAQLTAEEAAAEAKDWMSVRIDDQIYIKYTLQKRENLESVTVEYLDQDGVEAVQTKVYTADQLTFDANDMFEILAVIAPAQIGDLVKVTILANGQPTEYEYSVAKYCEYLIANYNGENARAVRELAKATLEYGKAANDYFYGTDFYHQSTITSPYSAEYKEEALHTAKNLTNTLSVTDNLRTKLASAAFMALTKPEFRFYTTGLTEAEAVELNSQITTNVDGVTAKFYKNGDAILLEVTGIEAANMDEVITITVGDLGTITFSGNDFARMLAKNASTQTLGAALYLYGDAAKKCFA